jgi:hypothetical protein
MTTAETLRSVMAPSYQPLLPEFFDRPTIVETRASCSNCAMCDRGDTPAGVSATHFHPDIKCCTYHPTLPNYLVGALLADPDPQWEEGQRRVREKIGQRVGVTPHWLAPPRKHGVLLDAARRSSFGRSKALVCPYYNGGLCSIWKHRESVCSTFFCKYDSAARGFTFWDGLKRYLSGVEQMLTAYAVSQVGPQLREPFVPRGTLTQADLEDRPPPETEYAEYWGNWLGREADFYIACHRAVATLDRQSFAELQRVSPELGTQLETLGQHYGNLLKPRRALKLMLNPQIESVAARDGVMVTAYHRYDPLFLNQALRDALDLLRPGETVETMKARLLREHELEFTDDLIGLLEDYRVLVSPKEP